MSLEPGHPNPIIIQFYDSRAPTYDTEDNAAFHPALAADFVTWAAAHLPPRLTAPLRLLDLCCGTGLVAHAAYARYGPSTTIHGVDISPASLDIARAKFPQPVTASTTSATTTSTATTTTGAGKRPRDIAFLQASATDLSALQRPAAGTAAVLLQEASYSLVTCCSAFVLLLPPAPANTTAAASALLAHWASYLRPGGVLIFDVPAPGTQLATLCASRALAAERRAAGAEAEAEAEVEAAVVVGDREWITGEQGGLREVIEATGGLQCAGVFLTRAYKEKRYGTGDAELEGLWEGLTRNPISGAEGMGEREREAAKRRFVRMMRHEAGEGGVVRDLYKLLVGIGVKRG